MGLKTRQWRPWSADEVKLLYELHQNQPLQSIADILGRSLETVSQKALGLGLRKCKFYPPWSIQEETLLKELYYPTNTVKDVAKRIGRSVSAVRQKARLLGLSDGHAWSKKELNLLRKLYPSKTAQEIANQIGRTVGVVRLKVFRLGLKKRKQRL